MELTHIAVALIFLVIGVVIGWGITRKSATSSEFSLRSQRDQAQVLLDSTQSQLNRESQIWGERVQALESQLREQQHSIEAERRRVSEQSVAESQAQGRVVEALAPISQRLETMQSAIAQMERQRQEQYGALGEQLKRAHSDDEQLKNITVALESALRNSSVRGSWGETQLRTIVESAGMIERVDFFVQHTITTDSGRKRPDMVVRLPGGKTLPIDAKAPFDAYLRAQNIRSDISQEHAEEHQAQMAQHVKALHRHIDELARRSYDEVLDGSPDFVIAFIPSEGLLSAALEHDPTLLEYAFSRRVALASPVTLWSVLRTVAYSWQQELLSEQAKEIFDLSRELYQRLGTMTQHADSMRKSIRKTVESWNSFAGSLEKRVLVTARKLESFDEKTELTQLSPIEESPRALTSWEYLSADKEEKTLPEVENS